MTVIKGRRRIGESSHIEHFFAGKNFIELYGIAPRPDITNQEQLDDFGELLGQAMEVPTLHFKNWNDALSTLAEMTADKPVIIYIDEISRLACCDKDPAVKLEGMWATKL